VFYLVEGEGSFRWIVLSASLSFVIEKKGGGGGGGFLLVADGFFMYGIDG
jgi:hypothetical protein